MTAPLFQLAPGEILQGRYRLDFLLGQGGAGSVWAATRHDGAHVALKFLLLQGSSYDARRLEREAAALSLMQHPHVVRLHEVLHDPRGRPVLVMDLLQGEPFSATIASRKLTLAEIATCLWPIADALHAAHGQGLVHRDLKPSNIYLTHQGRFVTPWLLDFGLVKLLQSSGIAARSLLTQSGDLLGTPQYMAPEQLGGERSIDHRADVWAMGVMLYECIVGLRPFRGTTLGQMIRAVLSGLQNPLSELDLGLPPGLAAMVDAMLVSNRDYRLASLQPARDLLRSLCGP